MEQPDMRLADMKFDRHSAKELKGLLSALFVGVCVGIAGALVTLALWPTSNATSLILLGISAGFFVGALTLGAASLADGQRREAELRAQSHAALKAQNQAVSASKAKSDFLATMSHEIRTPLTGVLGYADLLAEEKLNRKQARYAGRIQVAGRSLLTLIDDILDFSKIEAGEIRLHPQPFALGSLLDNVLSIVFTAAGTKTIRAELDPDLPKVVLGDEARIRQILLNLLNNAVKFTYEGQVTLKVNRVGDLPGGDQIRFSVIDTGIGIPKEKQALLFRRFSQLDSSISREFGGSGLGLAVSKQLVELMSGEIAVESDPGRGSVFWFTISLPEAELEVDEAWEDGAHEVSDLPLLLVEDLEENRELAGTILAKAGYEVETARNGFEALEAVRKKDYSLVLMDVQMPGMDGVSAAKAIRALAPPACDVPILAMTANVLPDQISRFRAAGMNDHIGKPFVKSSLLAKVRGWQIVRTGKPAAAAGAQTALPSADRTGAGAPAQADLLDAAALRELRDLMGEAWIARCAVRLRSLIDETFGENAPDLAERQEIARRAHDLVSVTAQLGFFPLSRQCSELEQICRGTGDPAETFARTRAASERIQGCLADLCEAPQPGDKSAARSSC